jgi:hypothetical protein
MAWLTSADGSVSRTFLNRVIISVSLCSAENLNALGVGSR